MHHLAGIRGQEGFTLIELLTSVAIIGILASMGMVYFNDVRYKSADSQAYMEGRHLLTAISDSVVNGEDVVFGDGSEITGAIGVVDTNGNPRDPIFSLSPDVSAKITGSNTQDPADALVTVYIWHERGTTDVSGIPTVNSDGKKEYYYYINELTGQLSTPRF